MKNQINKIDFKAQSQETEKEVIKIAEQELLKHYPGFDRDGGKLELVSVNPFAGSSNWQVMYDVAGWFDAQVKIIVNPVDKSIVSFVDSWA